MKSTGGQVVLGSDSGGKFGSPSSSSSVTAWSDAQWLVVRSPMIRTAQWSDGAAQVLSRALPPRTLRYIQAEVQRGISQLWECESEHHHAWCVTRIDRNPMTLVIVAFAGSGMLHFAPAFIGAASERGLRLRAHTMSEQLARVLGRRLRFAHREFVLVREVASDG